MTTSWRRPAGAFAAALALVVSLTGAAPAAAAPPSPGTLKVNEVESSGAADFVELFNTDAVAADIGGYVIKDNDDTHVFTIALGTMIAPGGHYLALTDGEGGFGLGAGDSARLFTPGGTLEDSYSWTAHAATTYGRCPNGTGLFTTTTSPTPGAANDCVPNVKINEVESSGVADFVELVNNGAGPADVGGYVVKDNVDTHVFTIALGTTIAPGGYLVVMPDVEGGFGLSGADSARLFTPGGALLDTYSWTAHAATTYGRCPNGTGAFTTTTGPTPGAENACGQATVNVKLNEVESSGAADFVELVNNGAGPADVGGYVVKDNDDTHVFTIPLGTTIAPAGHYVAMTDVPGGFGLGSADSARLFTPGGTLLETYSWTAHAATTYGRCPDGIGEFTTTTSPTPGAANTCAAGPPAALPWPGGTAVAFADSVNVFGTNLSGLAYQPSGSEAPGVLWAVRNGPSTLYRLLWDGAKWTPDTTNGWAAGKQLRYPDNTGDPDAEGVTLVDGNPANGVYVATERNNSVSGTSRPAVLRFDVSSAATTLVATRDWNLTADLPGLAPNAGPEAVQWISDAFLVAKGFVDGAGALYNPASYADHGTGLFFVGVEATGTIYAYALNQTTGAYTRVASFASGFTNVMGLDFEVETGRLWAICDNTCNGRSATLEIAQAGANDGKLVVTNTYERPAEMPNLNNEGFAITPQEECVAGRKPVFWSDDDNTAMHALRAGTLNCTVLIKPQTITFAQPAAIPFGSAPVALVASSTSTLPVSFTAAGPCSVSGTAAAPTLTATGAGTCTVTAGQAGNAAFAAATPVVRTVTINQAATGLRLRPVSLLGSAFSLRVTYSAVLTSQVTGEPIAGQTIVFRASASSTAPVACTAVTDGAGRATCTSPLGGLAAVLVARSTTARFAGSANYLPSSDTAPLRLF